MESKAYQVLRRKSDFEKLFTSGRRIYPSSWMTLNVTSNDTGALRCGWTVSRKVGNAVVRNRLKRWCRIFFKERATTELKAGVGIDINVVFRSVSNPKDFYRRLSFQDVVACLERGWRKAQTARESKPTKISPRAD